jgi:predicted nucleotidyltransferase
MAAKLSVIDRLCEIVERDPRIAYALIFGSAATGKGTVHSDVDLAIGLAGDRQLDTLDLGALTSEVEAAAGAPVDLVLLEEAPPGLAYRVFRDGRVIVARDPAGLARRRARAVLEYLDFQPVEALCARGVLAARHGG